MSLFVYIDETGSLIVGSGSTTKKKGKKSSSQEAAMRRSGQLHDPTTEDARLVIDNSTDVINL